MAPSSTSSGLVSTVRFKYATEQQVQRWRTSSDPIAATTVVDSPLRFIYELCWTVVHGDLPPVRIPAALQSAGLPLPPSASPDAGAVPSADQRAADEQSPPAPDVPSLLADTVAQLAFEVLDCYELRFQSIQCHPCSLLSLSAPLCLLSLSASLSLTSHQVLDCYEMQPTNSAFLHLVKLFPEVRAAAVLAVLCCAVLCRGGMCCAVLCGFLQCCAVRCYGVLCCGVVCANVAPLLNLFSLLPPPPLCGHGRILGFKFRHYHCLIATAAAASAAGSKGAKEGGGNSKGGEKGSAGKAGAGGGGAGRGDGDGEGGEKGEGGSGAEGRIPDSLFVLAANCLKSNVVQLAGL
ncbi:unnamed protein product [Closterium sp. NIES-54]